MALCRFTLLLLYASAAYASTSRYNLTSEITNFVPPCAQECFKSFLVANVPTSACSTTPTLACLCSTNSTSGYTIGEGAVQCIISEISIGFCTGEDAQENVATEAYNMCNGEEDALPNTHGTITATLIIQSSMPSVVLVAPIATITSIAAPTSSLSTRKSLSTSSGTSAISSQKSSSSSTNLPTRTISPTQSSTPSTTTSPQAISQTEAAVPVLTKPQVVGISVASVAGGGLIFGIIILFCCLRRRRKRREIRDSDLLPFQLDPPAHLMDGKKYKHSFRGPLERKPGGTANGIAARVRPQVPPRLDTSSPNMFSRRSIKPDTIGVAISPESNVAAEKQQRRSSKLLPEKPNLKLRMPPSPRGAGFSFIQPMGVPIRQSTATQFEEDDFNSADTAVNADDSWDRKSTERILDSSTDNTGNWPTITVVDPESGKPAAVVERGDAYHWRPPQASDQKSQLQNNIAAPDYYIKPLNLSRGIGSFSQPRRADSFLQPQSKSLQLTIPNTNRPLTGSSSVYSTRGSLLSSSGRHSAPRVHKSYRQSGPYDTRQSSGSLTSFDSATSGFSPIERDADAEKNTGAGALDLSPVVESPVSGGVSPVVYPKIPGRLSGTIVHMPPPPQPAFTFTRNNAIPPSSTTPLPRTVPGQAAQPIMPWRQAEINARRERDRVLRLQEQARIAARELQMQVGSHLQSKIPAALQIGGKGHRRNNSSSGSHPLYLFPTPAAIPRSQTTPPVVVDATGGFGYKRSGSAQSLRSEASASSSLLAKRVGEKRAQGLVLRNEEVDGRKWRVLGKEEIERAKEGDWRPMLGTGDGQVDTRQGQGRNEQRDVGGSRGDGGRSYETMQTPITPGWMPTLTPTRRGDDLFLSVQ